MWQTGWSSRVVKESEKKIDTNILEPKNPKTQKPNSIDFFEGEGKGGWAKGLAYESRDRKTPLQTKKKGYEERNGPQTWQQKSDMTYQPFCDDALHDLTFEQLDGPRGTVWPSESAHRWCSAPNRALTQGVLRGRCQTACNRSKRTAMGTMWSTSPSSEFTILIVWTEQCGMSESPRARRVLESPPRELIGGEASRGDDVTERKL